jgi:signal transduction histidine kinase
MVELVNALLDVSCLELGTFVIEPEATNIIELAQNVIDEQKPQIDSKKIRIKFTPE